MKSDFRSESLKREFTITHFVYNLMIGCYEKNRENYPNNSLGIKKPE